MTDEAAKNLFIWSRAMMDPYFAEKDLEKEWDGASEELKQRHRDLVPVWAKLVFSLPLPKVGK